MVLKNSSYNTEVNRDPYYSANDSTEETINLRTAERAANRAPLLSKPWEFQVQQLLLLFLSPPVMLAGEFELALSS